LIGHLQAWDRLNGASWQALKAWLEEAALNNLLLSVAWDA